MQSKTKLSWSGKDEWRIAWLVTWLVRFANAMFGRWQALRQTVTKPKHSISYSRWARYLQKRCRQSRLVARVRASFCETLGAVVCFRVLCGISLRLALRHAWCPSSTSRNGQVLHLHLGPGCIRAAFSEFMRRIWQALVQTAPPQPLMCWHFRSLQRCFGITSKIAANGSRSFAHSLHLQNPLLLQDGLTVKRNDRLWPVWLEACRYRLWFLTCCLLIPALL